MRRKQKEECHPKQILEFRKGKKSQYHDFKDDESLSQAVPVGADPSFLKNDEYMQVLKEATILYEVGVLSGRSSPWALLEIQVPSYDSIEVFTIWCNRCTLDIQHNPPRFLASLPKTSRVWTQLVDRVGKHYYYNEGSGEKVF